VSKERGSCNCTRARTLRRRGEEEDDILAHARERRSRVPHRVCTCLRVRICARARAPMRVVWVGVRMWVWVWVCVCVWEGEQHIVTAAPTTTESYKQTQGSWPLGGSSWQWCPRVVVDGCGTVVWGGARRRMIYWHEAD
jgi:hypothetical protein